MVQYNMFILLFNVSVFSCKHVANDTQSSSKSINDTASPFNVTCTEAFELTNNACRPRCDRFDSHSSMATAALLSSEMVAVSIGLFVCVLVIIFSAQNCKRT